MPRPERKKMFRIGKSFTPADADAVVVPGNKLSRRMLRKQAMRDRKRAKGA